MKDFIETSVGSSSAADKIDRFNNLETNEANVEKITVLDVMNATSSNDAVTKLVQLWENKNAKRALRGAGLTTMALSLAACGSDSEDLTPFDQDDIDAATTPIQAALTAAQAALGDYDSSDAAYDAGVAAGVASVDVTADNAAAITTALRDFAANAGVTGTASMTNAELVAAITAANDAAVRAGVDLTTDNATAIDAAVAALNIAGVSTLAQLYNAYIAETGGLTPDTDTVSFSGTLVAGETTSGGVAATEVLSIGDTIAGGAGSDTLRIVSSDNYTALPVGVTLSSVENLTILGGGTVAINTTGAGFASLTDVSVLGAVGAITVTGAATQALSVTDATATGVVTVNGGSDVSVNVGTQANAIIVGTTTAAGGAVSVVADGGVAGGTMGAITVTGGTSISATQTATDHAVNTTATHGIMTLTGDDSTTSITAVQSEAATARAAVDAAAGTAPLTAVRGVTNGNVIIADGNAGSTAANTLTTVSITNAGAATVDSHVLSTLNLSGTITSVNATNTNPGTAAVTTVALNVDDLTTTGAVTIDPEVTTLNINGTNAASTIASLVAAGATTVNSIGSADVTVSASTLTAVTDINVTGTGGFSLAGAIGAAVTFDGGAGDDAVTLSTGFTTSINMGAGNDTITWGGPGGTGGVADLGAGTDTVAFASSANAVTASADAAFNADFLNLEAIEVLAALTGTIDAAALGGATSITLNGNNAAGVINGLTSGSTVTLNDASTSVTANITNAVVNTGDVLNLVLSNDTNGTVAFGTVTSAGTETVNISTTDAGTGANVVATLDTATLVATSATTINVSGNNGLTLTNAGNTAVTTFNAAGVVADTAVADSAALLAVTFVSANTTATATVSITGGEGNDTLTGAAAIDTIVGGAGNDIITGGTGTDTLTGGAGADTFIFAGGDSSAAAHDVITDYTAAATRGDTIDLNGAVDIAEDETASAGVAVGVTITVDDGILTLGGAGASAIDTLAEWVVEANATVDVNDESVAFEFNGDTYVYQQTAAGDLLIELQGVTGITDLAGAAAANTILIA